MPSLDQTLLQLIDLAASHFLVPASELNPDDDFFKKLEDQQPSGSGSS
jgi:hypothetical protein